MIRSVLQGFSGGVIGGSLLGLVEAFFLLFTQGAPDLVSPAYAVVLYGLIGGALGLTGGVAAAFNLRRFGAFAPVPEPPATPDDAATPDDGAAPDPEGAPIPRLVRYREPLAFSLGLIVAVGPMLTFIGFYLGNKVLWAEQGVPLTGGLWLLGGVLVLLLLQLSLGTWLLSGRLAQVLRLPYAALGWGGLVALCSALALVPTGWNPRSVWAHDKPVPAPLAAAPNVLLIAIDTLRADHLGAYGMEGDPTPVLDGIARDGVLFEDATAHSSWTRSSFASLWSSRLPSSHRADQKASRLSDDLVLLPEVLQGAGVATGSLVNNINVTRTFNFDQGWDTFIYEAPDYHFGATESVFSLTFYKVIHKLRERLGGAKRVSTYYQPAEVVLGDARGFIEANRSSRWMLSVHLMEPHDPYFEHPYLMPGGSGEAYNGVGFARAQVERPSLDQAPYLRKLYLDEIRHLDRKLLDFVAWLKAEGLYDDLLIVVTSDHGEEFGEHGGFWHGTTLYEEQIHVPLIVKLPKGELAGERVPWQARLIDVAPTITAALGLPSDPSWAGRDLVVDVRAQVAERQAGDEAMEEARRTVAMLAEARDAGVLNPDGLSSLAEAESRLAFEGQPVDPCAAYAHPLERVAIAEQDFEGNVLSAVKAGGFKRLTANAGNPRGLPEVALYDLRADPGETADLRAVSSPVCGSSPAARAEALATTLATELGAAAAGAVQREDVQVDAAETCRLCALGYLDGARCADC